jgi:hypothetical protein
MKTIKWKRYANTYYLPMQEDNLTCYEPNKDHSGRYVRAEVAEGLMAERDRLKEDLETSRRLSDTFWDALKPLGLKEIFLNCPGQHVVDLINERDRLEKALNNVQDERAASFAMLQKTIGMPYGLTPYQPECDLEIAANIQSLRARLERIVEAAKNHVLTAEYLYIDGFKSEQLINDFQSSKSALWKEAIAEAKEVVG